MDAVKCYHSGLPIVMCAHCSGAHGPIADEFRPQGRDETPRFVKGRDKAEWQGIGQSTGTLGTESTRNAAVSLSRNGTQVPKSEWAVSNALRTLVDLKLPRVSIPLVLSPAKIVGEQRVAISGKRMDCDTRLAPPKNRTQPIPHVFPCDTMASRKAVKRQGRSAGVLKARVSYKGE